jgi:hypothetical protein
VRENTTPGTAGFPVSRKYYATASTGLGKAHKELFNTMLNYRSVQNTGTWNIDWNNGRKPEQLYDSIRELIDNIRKTARTLFNAQIKSLSLLFAGELTVFAWQLSCYLKITSRRKRRAFPPGKRRSSTIEKRNIMRFRPPPSDWSGFGRFPELKGGGCFPGGIRSLSTKSPLRHFRWTAGNDNK